MPKAQRRIVRIEWVSTREMNRLVDSRAQRVFGISGKDFRKKFAAGKLGRKSLDGTAGTVELATLCSFTDGGKSAKSYGKRGRN